MLLRLRCGTLFLWECCLLFPIICYLLPRTGITDEIFVLRGLQSVSATGEVAPPNSFRSQIINVEDLKKKKKILPKYTTKDGLLRDNFSRIYYGNRRITKSTLLKILLQNIFTRQINDKACLNPTALKYSCHNLKTHKKDSSVRSSDAVYVFRVWTVVDLGTHEWCTHCNWTTEQILKAKVTYCAFCQTISYTGLFNSWQKSLFFSPKILMETIGLKGFPKRRWKVLCWDCGITEHWNRRQQNP